MHLKNIAESVETFGPRYLERIFTPREIAWATAGDDVVGRLGECFAAKEAMAKALGVRPEASLPWRSIEAFPARAEVRANGVTLPVQVTRHGEYAFAMVVGLA